MRPPSGGLDAVSLVGLPLGGHRLVLKLGVHALHVQKTHYESDTLCSECAKSHYKVVTCFLECHKTHYEVLTFLRTCSKTHYEVITSFVPFRSKQ